MGRLKLAFENVSLLADHLQEGALAPVSTPTELTDRARKIQDLQGLADRIRNTEPTWTSVIGPPFRGNDTDWDGIVNAAEWIDELYDVAPSPSPEMLEILLDSDAPRPQR